MKLQNRVALITGAAQGIGRAIALRFAAEGANVAVADLQEEKAIAVAKEIESLGRKAVAFKADVTREADAQRIVTRTVDMFGKLNILVNNAGIEYC
ncbi:MAG: SDR family NAD(P)-dependent oxidoreductase [Deltaproteobacteria bacterium]|nr:SDR family NAD(P)-dependent oxidoreductase [Deltaproteobacteria bacterium]